MNTFAEGHHRYPRPSLVDGCLMVSPSWLERVPDAAVACLARVPDAAVAWKSGQTTIEGFRINGVERTMNLGLRRLSDSAVDLVHARRTSL